MLGRTCQQASTKRKPTAFESAHSETISFGPSGHGPGVAPKMRQQPLKALSGSRATGTKNGVRRELATAFVVEQPQRFGSCHKKAALCSESVTLAIAHIQSGNDNGPPNA
jgi:hypothetical protein